MTQSSINDDKDADIEGACEEFKTNCFLKYEYGRKSVISMCLK